jgi:hypothetical protein
VDSAVKLIEAIAKLLGAVAWPAAVIAIAVFLLRRHRRAVDGILDRVESLTLPGGVEVSIGKIEKQQEQNVIAAAAKVADAPPEDREPAINELVTQSQLQRKVRRLREIVHDNKRPDSEREKALRELSNLGVVAIGHSREEGRTLRWIE